jgi:hypothetical protein
MTPEERNLLITVAHFLIAHFGDTYSGAGLIAQALEAVEVEGGKTEIET